MKKRLVSMLLVLCMVFTMLPITASAAPPLYKVKVEHGAPFYITEWGSVVGNIPWGTVLQVHEIKQGGFAKVKYGNYLVYVWADNLNAVDKPDSVCSEWSRKYITSMEGEFVGLKSKHTPALNDYTKPITRLKMAEMLMSMMVAMRGIFLPSDFPVVLKGVWQPLTDTEDRNANILATWGVVPPGRFRPNDIATYGEVVNAVIKLMAYDNKYFCIPDYGAPRPPVTKKMIAKLGIGGNTSANAPCRQEQFMVMYSKLACWAADYNLRWYAADAKARAPKKTTEGLFCITSGTYTIQTALGEEGKHPYVNINSAGKGELRSGKPQRFKITYLKSDLGGRRYTIQTMNGKYLAMDGLAFNGSPLITRKMPYYWYISNGNLAYLISTENSCQRLNASGQQSADKTPIISWDLTSTYSTGNLNYRFIFELAKKK